MDFKRFDKVFWEGLDSIVSDSELIIDRPKGSAHPRYPQMIYPVDYGYLAGTSSMDGGGIDIWVGSRSARALDAVLCIIDRLKKDSEIKILLGCTVEEKEMIYRFHNSKYMSALYIQREYR